MIRIRRAALETVVAHARAELPNECCGLLIGSADVIDEAAAARNLEASPTRYRIDPADHFRAIRRARAAGLSVVGAYHSHPASAPDPSRTDEAEISYPDYVYLIVSPAGEDGEAEVRAYRPAGEGFRRIDLIGVA